MSFNIDSGLFLFDFNDCHAVLGVTIDADFKEIRKRYLHIARRLHPDTCKSASISEKQQANSLLSKLVNPAYEKFTAERSRAEYMVMLNQISKRLIAEAAAIQLKNELSVQLKQSNNIERDYKTIINQLAQNQYESLEEVLAVIAQISELNVVYLMHKAGSVQVSSPSTAVQPSNTPSPVSPAPAQAPETPASAYLRRAQVLIEKNIFAQARVELQDALKLEPNNSRTHTLIGLVYLKQNQTTMAKVHINKALQLDPTDAIATKIKQQLDSSGVCAAHSTTQTKTTNQQSSQPKSGGMFGGLFGGKKK